VEGKAMGAVREPVSELILNRAFDPERRDGSSPTVLSCGGIYIPHRGCQEEILLHIITTSRADEPVRVVTGAKPRNSLREVLLKESMN
jgi:hypothetical protein